MTQIDPPTDFQDRLAAAQRRVFEHPGYQEYRLCLAFQRSISAVFVQNWRDLLTLLEQASADSKLALELVQNVRPPVVRDKFHADATQRLHNYVAGTMTLVEHSRRIMRDRTGPISDQLEQKKVELLRNPEVGFIHNLRNFMLHRTLPFFAHHLSMANVNTPQQTMTSEVELSVAELIEWHGWSPASRQFMEELGETVTLRPLIRRHGQMVVGINSWLHDQLALANEAALEDANRLVVERNAVLTSSDIAEAEKATERWTNLRAGSVQPEQMWPKGSK